MRPKESRPSIRGNRKNEIASSWGLKAQKLAFSNAAAPGKSNPTEGLGRFFTDDQKTPSPWGCASTAAKNFAACRLPAAGRCSSRRPNGPRPRRRRRFRQTVGTAGRIPAVPSERGSNKAPTTASPAAVLAAESAACQSANRARQASAPAPRSESSGLLASDDHAAPAPPGRPG